MDITGLKVRHFLYPCLIINRPVSVPAFPAILPELFLIA